jgi:K+-transporting ATPase A subunit
MININIFLIIIVLFVLFIVFQIYLYNVEYSKKNKLIKKIENFESSLENIDKKEYLLDDSSIKILLEDYNNLKNNL